MKRLQIRDFQRNFCKIKGEILEVLNGEGIKVGTWMPGNGLDDIVGQALVEPSDNLGKGELLCGNEGLVDIVGHDDEEAEISTCDKCGKGSAEAYNHWEDGEDFIICIDCIKKTIPPKMLKSHLAKLRKL